MLMRVVAVMLLLSAGIAAEAMSYSFVSKASGRLGGPIRFEFYHDSTTRPKTDIESFTVSMRTAHDRWKAMWSIFSGRGLTQPNRHTAHSQERLFDECSHRAQVLGRGRNEQPGRPFRRNRSRSAHGIELETAEILFVGIKSGSFFDPLVIR